MTSRCRTRPDPLTERDTIASRRDLLRPVLAAASMMLVALAGWVDLPRLATAAERTATPFLTLALVIAGGAIADRFGLFRLLAKVVLSERVPSLLASARVL